jgi:hypothetical protein
MKKGREEEITIAKTDAATYHWASKEHGMLK